MDILLSSPSVSMAEIEKSDILSQAILTDKQAEINFNNNYPKSHRNLAGQSRN